VAAHLAGQFSAGFAHLGLISECPVFHISGAVAQDTARQASGALHVE
jgi:hypothetical protein